LKEILQIDADAIPPKKISCQGVYKGFESISASNAAEASVTDISSWITYVWDFNYFLDDLHGRYVHANKSRMHLALFPGPEPSLAV
jgi:hypothetical protein